MSGLNLKINILNMFTPIPINNSIESTFNITPINNKSILIIFIKYKILYSLSYLHSCIILNLIIPKILYIY